MPFKYTLTAFLALTSLCVFAAEPDEDKEDVAKADAENQQIAKKLLESTVVVQYSFKFDNGDDPVALDTWGQGSQNQSGRVDARKPLEMPGYLLSNGEVVTPDILAPSRFVKNITVVYGGISKRPASPGQTLRRAQHSLNSKGSSTPNR